MVRHSKPRTWVCVSCDYTKLCYWSWNNNKMPLKCAEALECGGFLVGTHWLNIVFAYQQYQTALSLGDRSITFIQLSSFLLIALDPRRNIYNRPSLEGCGFSELVARPSAMVVLQNVGRSHCLMGASISRRSTD